MNTVIRFILTNRLGFFAYKRWFCIISILLSISYNGTAQWDRNAGYIPAHTIGAIVTTSSVGNGNAHFITDGQENTNWQSDPPLPEKYLSRTDQNFLYQQGTTLLTTTSAHDFTNATDGNTNSATTDIAVENGFAQATLTLPNPQALLLMSLKCHAQADIEIYSFTSDTDSTLVGLYSFASQNFSLQRYDFSTEMLTKVKLYSTASFSIFEWGILTDYPKEYAIIDFGTPQSIGHILTRHWAGNATAVATNLWVSNDQVAWTPIASLEPNALFSVWSFASENTTARYLKIEHSVVLENYKSVYIWEVACYDENGIYGAMPPAAMSSITFGEMLGVNSVWGWGHDQYSNLLGSGEGPTLHNTYSTHARNYHFMNWDVTDPDNIPDYTTMANGGGTEAQWWLNWDQEYQAWTDAQLEVIGSIQFSNDFPQEAWDTPFQSAFNYGQAYAAHFGGSFGNGLVQTLEIGNEPWDYDTLVYQNILAGMASGAKLADPFIQVFPCALQAHNPFVEDASTGFRHYMGARVKESAAPFLDGLNVHAYSFINNDMGEQVASHPEHPACEMRSVLSVLRFRDQNMPNKKVYLTEWGWDSDSTNEDCTHAECVSENAAASYIVRAALWWLRLGIDKATCFFYANSPEPSFLFKRSGLTESSTNNFAKKKTFHNLQMLVDSIGDKHFLAAPIESDSAWLYLFGNAQGTATHLVAWRPIDGDDTTTKTVYWTGDYKAVSATRMDGSPTGLALPTPSDDGATMALDIRSTPTLLTLHPRPCMEELYLTSNSIYSIAYRVINKITSNALLPNGSNIQFRAGDSISLQQGFEVPLGTEFEAIMEDCQE